MRAEELTVLLQCPKKYELKQVILDEEFQKYNGRAVKIGDHAQIDLPIGGTNISNHSKSVEQRQSGGP